MLHLALHALTPALLARLLYPARWLACWAWMMAAMLVDLDHLLAEPIYDPSRCSIGFHPLHQWPAILLYAALLAWKPARIVALGLLIHMALDSIDCRCNTGLWYHTD